MIRSLESELRAASYIVPEPVRLAQLLHGLNSNQGLENISDERERITKHMDAGDALRKKLKVGGVMAALAISVIKEIRKDYPESRRVAYILRSLKHPGEVELLREVYGPALYVLSVYEDKKSRVRRLAQRLQKKGNVSEGTVDAASEIVERDATGSDKGKFGQSVQKTFPLADFFVQTGPGMHEEVRRFVRMLLRYPFLTPTRDEHAMFLAQASALRSSDLSRQVGAVIVNEHSDVLASGCNEVF